MPRIGTRWKTILILGFIIFDAVVAAYFLWPGRARGATPWIDPSAHVRGRLMANGEPLSGYLVIQSHDPWIGIPPKTATLANGYFDFGAVPFGRMSLRFDTPGGAGLFTQTERFDVVESEDRYVVIDRDVGYVSGELSGALGDSESLRVFLDVDGKSGSIVGGSPHLEAPTRIVKPDHEGKFTVGPMVRGSYWLDVERWSTDRPWGEYVSAKTTPVVVSKGATTLVPPVEVLAQVQFSGRFVLPPDARLAKIVVRSGIWFYREYGEKRTGGTAHVASDGSFSLKLVPGTYAIGSLGIDDDPHVAPATVVIPPDGASSVVITLRDGAK